MNKIDLENGIYKNVYIVENIDSGYKFDINIYDKSFKYKNINKIRTVVRGFMIKDGRILVVFPKKLNTYGIPGGGVDDGETLVDALYRELKEEVGADKIEIIEYIGKASTFRKGGSNKIVNSIHNYFLVNISKFGETKLLEYEKELGLQYSFINIDDVIKRNELIIENRDFEFIDFYLCQTVIFKYLKEIYNI